MSLESVVDIQDQVRGKDDEAFVLLGLV